jgi:hypothetical protein
VGKDGSIHKETNGPGRETMTTRDAIYVRKICKIITIR